MIARVLLDTGPLVALLARDDIWHERCTEQLRELSTPLYTAWPVLVESDWLLRTHSLAVQQMLVWVQSGIIQVLPIGGEASSSLAAFLRKYQKLRPQLADASLVYLAEREDIDTVFTLDRRDFSVYRFGRNRKFRIVP